MVSVLVSYGVAGMLEDGAAKGELNGWKNCGIAHTFLLSDGQASKVQSCFSRITFIELGVYIAMSDVLARSFYCYLQRLFRVKMPALCRQ